LIIIIKLLM